MYNLDVTAPDRVPIVLETVADFYRESADELASTWQDGSGAIWNDFAIILDRAAAACRKAMERRGL